MNEKKYNEMVILHNHLTTELNSVNTSKDSKIVITKKLISTEKELDEYCKDNKLKVHNTGKWTHIVMSDKDGNVVNVIDINERRCLNCDENRAHCFCGDYE